MAKELHFPEEQTKEMLSEALRAYFAGEAVRWTAVQYPSASMTALFSLAARHRVENLVFEAVREGEAYTAMPEELRMRLRKGVYQSVMAQTGRSTAFLALYETLREAGIMPIVMKGIVCRTMYPHPDHRPSSDEDLLIPPRLYPACRDLLLGMGGVYAEGRESKGAPPEETPYEQGFFVPIPGGRLYIEVHTAPFAPGEEPDCGAWFAAVFDRAEEMQVPGGTVLTMCPEDHLLYLILHAYKHFIHAGVGIRQICDIGRMAELYGPRVDWSRLWQALSSVRAEGLAAAFLAVGEGYLGMHVSPSAEVRHSIDTADPEPLWVDMITGGIYGASDMGRQHSSTVTLNAVRADRRGRTASPLASLFPNRASLVGKYPYLKKRGYLLPVAWTQRICSYLSSLRQRGGGGTPAESLRVGRERVALLRRYGIID